MSPAPIAPNCKCSTVLSSAPRFTCSQRRALGTRHCRCRLTSSCCYRACHHACHRPLYICFLNAFCGGGGVRTSRLSMSATQQVTRHQGPPPLRCLVSAFTSPHFAADLTRGTPSEGFYNKKTVVLKHSRRARWVTHPAPHQAHPPNQHATGWCFCHGWRTRFSHAARLRFASRGGFRRVRLSASWQCGARKPPRPLPPAAARRSAAGTLFRRGKRHGRWFYL